MDLPQYSFMNYSMIDVPENERVYHNTEHCIIEHVDVPEYILEGVPEYGMMHQSTYSLTRVQMNVYRAINIGWTIITVNTHTRVRMYKKKLDEHQMCNP